MSKSRFSCQIYAKIEIFLTDVRKIFKYQVSRKFRQFVQTDGQT